MTTEHVDDVVVVTRVAPSIVTIAINRPERRNALNLEVKAKIADAVVAADEDPSVQAIVLTGSSTVFVAGTDIAEMLDMTPTSHTRDKTDRVFTVLNACNTPIIAAVEGYALGGGCELAMCCDMIVAAEGAQFGQPEIKLGIIPGGGGTQRFVRAVGRYQAMRILLTGEFIPAPQFFAMGLASEVTADGTALPRALELAAQIVAMPPLAVAAIRELVRIGPDLPMTAALTLERKAFQILFDSHDQAEGMQAFLDKRPPEFTGE